MTLDCRTLWSVRFCAAKGHFCSLLLSNILVTSAFCRLTIFSNWLSFHIPKFFHLCPFLRDALTGWNFIQSINRLTVPSEISEFAIFDYSQQPYVLASYFRKNGGRKSFFSKGAFLLWLYTITTFSLFQAAILYNLSNFHLYKMQISVIITNITVDDSSRLC